MKEQMRNNILAAVRENLPKGTNLTNYLSDILNIGRESAYRRIRGKINFTFEEIVKLSQDLNFSVDNIIGAKNDENALFNIHMLQKIDYMDIYVNKIQEYGRMFKSMSENSTTKARLSINALPYFFYIRYELLSRFRIYKWLYQNQKIAPYDKFSDFKLPEKVEKTHNEFYQNIQKVPNVTIIMDNNVFRSASRDIEYFLKRGLLSDEDVLMLKTELYDITNDVEQMATTGKGMGGAKIEMYVSAVDLEASYLHLESEVHNFSQVRIYSISAIDSHNKGLCSIQKEWIESLKRYSVLISESGEMQRFEYLKQQRKYIENITE